MKMTMYIRSELSTEKLIRREILLAGGRSNIYSHRGGAFEASNRLLQGLPGGLHPVNVVAVHVGQRRHIGDAAERSGQAVGGAELVEHLVHRVADLVDGGRGVHGGSLLWVEGQGVGQLLGHGREGVANGRGGVCRAGVRLGAHRAA